MYYLTTAIALFLISSNELFFILSFFQKSFVRHIAIINDHLLLYRVVFFIGGFLSLILLISSLIGLSAFQPLMSLVVTQQQISGLHKSGIVTDSSLIKLIGYEQLGGIDQYYYVYFGKDISQQTLTSLAYTIRTRVCKKSCVISFYDNENAYVLDKQRETIVDTKVMQEWNKNNYLFVAEHYLGYLPAKAAPDFNYFPMKDAYYQTLHKNLK